MKERHPKQKSNYKNTTSNPVHLLHGSETGTTSSDLPRIPRSSAVTTFNGICKSAQKRSKSGGGCWPPSTARRDLFVAPRILLRNAASVPLRRAEQDGCMSRGYRHHSHRRHHPLQTCDAQAQPTPLSRSVLPPLTPSHICRYTQYTLKLQSSSSKLKVRVPEFLT